MPSVFQPKAAPQHANKMPTAPPPYWPQAAPKCLQPKAAAPLQTPPKRAKATLPAPLVYRLQAVPRVLQCKLALVQTPHAAQVPQPHAVQSRYVPLLHASASGTRNIVQPKTGFDARGPKPLSAPPVYRTGAPPRLTPVTPVQPQSQVRSVAPAAAPLPVHTPPNAGTVQPSPATIQMIKQVKVFTRPGFRTNAEDGAFTKHSLSEHTFKITKFRQPGLKKINATMPHRMAWMHLRGNTLKFYNRDENEKSFKRWTLRLIRAGEEKIGETENELQDIVTQIGRVGELD
jgi:hypothetical protein